jgi:hypothetical protein
MPVCPSCTGKVSPWRVLRLTNFNSLTCTGCNTVLVANRPRNSLIGAIGGSVGGSLLYRAINGGSYLPVLVWFAAVALVTIYANKLEVKSGDRRGV